MLIKRKATDRAKQNYVYNWANRIINPVIYNYDSSNNGVLVIC